MEMTKRNRKGGILTVIAPLKDTPAYKAGIKSGDKILKINETITNDMTVDEAIKKIRGERGTSVTLTIFHENGLEPKEIKVTRDIINVPTLDTELRKDGIFVIKLYSFSANSAELFRNAIKEFTESNSDKLVLDLRGNPGGYLEAAVDMAGSSEARCGQRAASLRGSGCLYVWGRGSPRSRGRGQGEAWRECRRGSRLGSSCLWGSTVGRCSRPRSAGAPIRLALVGESPRSTAR
jgi:C-terminal processing protease CtpA/Prc